MIATVNLFAEPPSPLSYKMEPLSMKECLSQALQYNLDIEIESYNPRIREFDLKYAHSVFDPALTSTFLVSETEREVVSSSLDSNPVSIYTTRSVDWEVGVAKRHILGGSVGLYYGIDYAKSLDVSSSIRNPQWGHGINLKISQPLLRGLGIQVNMTDIYVARNEQDRAYYLLHNKMISVLADVETAYWDLVNAIANYELQRKSLEQAENLYKITQTRIKYGTSAPADILDAERNVAYKQDSLVVAERSIYDTEDRLKQLIRPLDVSYYKDVRLLPTEQPVFKSLQVDFDACLKEAMEQRPDLKASEISLRNINLSIDKAENQMLPKLDLAADVGFRGNGHASSEAWDGMKDGDAFSWSVQLSLEIPIGNRGPRSKYMQALLERKQIILEHKSLENLVIFQVRAASRQLTTAMQRVETARRTRELAEKQLANEENKFRAGKIPLYQVQDTEEKLIEARIAESNTLLDYQRALVQLEKVKGTLLQSLSKYGITIAPKAISQDQERTF